MFDGDADGIADFSISLESIARHRTAESVIVPDEQAFDVQGFVEHVAHKALSGEIGHFSVEVQHHRTT